MRPSREIVVFIPSSKKTSFLSQYSNPSDPTAAITIVAQVIVMRTATDMKIAISLDILPLFERILEKRFCNDFLSALIFVVYNLSNISNSPPCQ